MSTAIFVGDSTNVVLRNIGIRGFDYGVQARNSSVTLDNVSLMGNNVGASLVNTNALINNSRLTGNNIDLIIDNVESGMSVEILDSIVETVIANRIHMHLHSQPVNLRIDPYKIMASVRAYRKAVTPSEKRVAFKRLLKQIAEYAGYAGTFYGILQMIMSLFYGN